MEFTTPHGGHYFLLLGLQCGDAFAADRCSRPHERSDMREKSYDPDMASAFALRSAADKSLIRASPAEALPKAI
jgi:hypothetical protein